MSADEGSAADDEGWRRPAGQISGGAARGKPPFKDEQPRVLSAFTFGIDEYLSTASTGFYL